MKLKKIIAAVVAAAVVTTMTAFSAFAATIELDSENPGAWGAGATIPKADLQAIGGDVKITLTVTPKTLVPSQMVMKPMDYDNSWTEITSLCTSDTEVSKSDGFIAVKQSQTTVSFVVPAATVEGLGDSGIGFQVNNVTVNSAELSLAAGPEGAFKSITDALTQDYSMEVSTYEELMGVTEAPATEEAPAADNTTTATTTGNTTAAVIVSVMAIAAAAAVATKKRK